MKHEESRLQAAVVATIRMVPGCREFFAIPNGGARHIAVAARLKREGVLAGIPDLFLPVPTNKSHGLFLEVKAQKGRLSPAQEEVSNRLMAKGYGFRVVRSVEEAVGAVKEYLGQ